MLHFVQHDTTDKTDGPKIRFSWRSLRLCARYSKFWLLLVPPSLSSLKFLSRWRLVEYRAKALTLPLLLRQPRTGNEVLHVHAFEDVLWNPWPRSETTQT